MDNVQETNIIKHDFVVDRKARSIRLNQVPKLIWFTGLSGSGKSTIANALEQRLFKEGFSTYALDGDNVRVGICNNLGFSAQDRKENIRRIGEVAKLMLDSGLIVTASFVSPFADDREMVKNIIGEDNYFEVYVKTSLAECESRDVKGLYAKARRGEIKDFTGVSSPYEPPRKPNIVIDTSKLSVSELTETVYKSIIHQLK